MRILVALDQGTTSSRAIVFDEAGHTLASHAIEFKQHYPRPGWVEHDPDDILGTQVEALQKAVKMSKVDVRDIAAIGITNQRETTLLWEKDTGRCVHNAIVWQCRRTAPLCEQLKEDRAFTDYVQEHTGLLIDAYFSATKLSWILDHVEGARARAEAGELLFGTVDSWLVWKLTGGKVHITDCTNASRTMLFDIQSLCWDPHICGRLGIPMSMLPQVRDSSGIYGSVELQGAQIPIAGIAGDQQAALFGQLCVEQGMSKTTYGTGCFVMMNTGDRPVFSQNGMLTTIAWKIGEQVTYALEGSVFVGGAAIQWLRDGLEIVRSAHETEELALSVADSDGVYFVPALTGLGAPYWDQYARGLLVGLTRGTTRAHIVRAALEGIAFEVYDVIRAMEHDATRRSTEMKVDGGAVANNFLMQFQSDLTRGGVVRPKILETTAMGAAYLAGLAVGFWKDTEEIGRYAEVERRFEPEMPQSESERRIERWHEAVGRAGGWAKDD